MWSALYGKIWNAETHEIQGGIKIFVFLHHVFVVVTCLLLVHGVEPNVGVIALGRLKVRLRSLLDAVWSQPGGPWNQFSIPKHTSEGRRWPASHFPRCSL
jgi:hypothetical protein